jgi:hypothetical protein
MGLDNVFNLMIYEPGTPMGYEKYFVTGWSNELGVLLPPFKPPPQP